MQSLDPVTTEWWGIGALGVGLALKRAGLQRVAVLLRYRQG